MNELKEVMGFIDVVTVASTNAVIGIVKERKRWKEEGGKPSLSFLHNNQWYRTLSNQEKKQFRQLALLYITSAG